LIAKTLSRRRRGYAEFRLKAGMTQISALLENKKPPADFPAGGFSDVADARDKPEHDDGGYGDP
jgi:hypothetical protein